MALRGNGKGRLGNSGWQAWLGRCCTVVDEARIEDHVIGHGRRCEEGRWGSGKGSVLVVVEQEDGD